MRRAAAIVALLLLAAPACRRAEEPASAPSAAPAAAAAPTPRLPAGDAGRVLAKAIEAAGGWETWSRSRDVSYICTMTIFGALGDPASETIFAHKMPLHRGVVTRLDSIGLGDELIFGFDGEGEWMMQGGRVVSESSRIAFTRFHALSSAFWFSLPFALAELPAEVTYIGSETDGASRSEKLHVSFPDSVPLPFDWLVLYFDVETGRLDRVHVRALAEFLQHSLWLGVWREPREAGGIRYNRRRAFFPANAAGDIVGGVATEQLVEHVEVDRGFPPELFQAPLRALGSGVEIES